LGALELKGKLEFTDDFSDKDLEDNILRHLLESVVELHDFILLLCAFSDDSVHCFFDG
jgi:hypothetical protein